MIPNHTEFLDAIRERRLVRIVFYSHPDAGKVDRECAPLDYGPEPGTADALNRYWVWDPASAPGRNPLGLLPDQIVNVQVLGKDFDPGKIETGSRPWAVPRNWAPRRESNAQPVTAAAPRI